MEAKIQLEVGYTAKEGRQFRRVLRVSSILLTGFLIGCAMAVALSWWID